MLQYYPTGFLVQGDICLKPSAKIFYFTVVALPYPRGTIKRMQRWPGPEGSGVKRTGSG